MLSGSKQPSASTRGGQSFPELNQPLSAHHIGGKEGGPWKFSTSSGNISGKVINSWIY